ncbi:MAG: hypothetical protein FWC68_03465 [Oscillospiraceae bacterium]|nr:hypothetical protein [Oscillospiraceae bacterium]
MEEKEVRIRFNIMAVLLICMVCFAITPITLQNDTFYTIRVGEHILEHGIDGYDPFSWHEDLTYVYPHWAYTVVTYLVYSMGRNARNISYDCVFMYDFRINDIFYKCKVSG